jgi:hypothetical protein
LEKIESHQAKAKGVDVFKDGNKLRYKPTKPDEMYKGFLASKPKTKEVCVTCISNCIQQKTEGCSKHAQRKMRRPLSQQDDENKKKRGDEIGHEYKKKL